MFVYVPTPALCLHCHLNAAPLELSLVLCDDARIRELNLEWRGLDAPTDVLSFEMESEEDLEDEEGGIAAQVGKRGCEVDWRDGQVWQQAGQFCSCGCCGVAGVPSHVGCGSSAIILACSTLPCREEASVAAALCWKLHSRRRPSATSTPPVHCLSSQLPGLTV